MTIDTSRFLNPEVAHGRSHPPPDVASGYWGRAATAQHSCFPHTRQGRAHDSTVSIPPSGPLRIKASSAYEAFPAPEARRLAERFEWHYTPKHGSWLDMAESELGVLSAQCLDRRVPDKQTLNSEIAAWQGNRNTHHAKADWQFTTTDARVKLRRLYPQFE